MEDYFQWHTEVFHLKCQDNFIPTFEIVFWTLLNYFTHNKFQTCDMEELTVSGVRTDTNYSVAHIGDIHYRNLTKKKHISYWAYTAVFSWINAIKCILLSWPCVSKHFPGTLSVYLQCTNRPHITICNVIKVSAVFYTTNQPQTICERGRRPEWCGTHQLQCIRCLDCCVCINQIGLHLTL